LRNALSGQVSLGADVAIVSGPVGNGMNLDVGIEAAPVYSYIKSKGIYGGVQINGNIILERSDENARYYGHAVKAKEILLGGAVAIPESAEVLHTCIAAAEGKEVDLSVLPIDINVSPSDQSGGVADDDELAAAQTADQTVDPANPPALPRRNVPPIPTSPRHVDPEHPDEQIKKSSPSTSPNPPPRPPRRFVGQGSPSPSPRASMEGLRDSDDPSRMALDAPSVL